MNIIYMTLLIVFGGGFLFAWAIARSCRNFNPYTPEEEAILAQKPLEICCMCNGIIKEESHKSTTWIGAHEWCEGYY